MTVNIDWQAVAKLAQEWDHVITVSATDGVVTETHDYAPPVYWDETTGIVIDGQRDWTAIESFTLANR